ncbi:MAG: hypothetical protein ACP5SP_07140 [Caldisericum sp.]|uniref:hypothetical protein n=1 Tax=Caldisericum sp. TaxID=2499687 RepID=UPI003D11CEE2
MRIAYLIHCNFEKEYLVSGVYKKVLSQIKAWVNLRNEVEVFQVTEFNSGIPLLESHWRVFKYQRSNYPTRIKAWYKAEKAIEQWSPDLIYMRYEALYPPLLHLFLKFPVIVEVNTNDVRENCLGKNLARCLYNLVFRNLTFLFSSGIIFVTNEIQNYFFNTIFKKPRIVIGNSIDLPEYELFPPSVADDYNFVFIGSNAPWHGVDKIIQLARLKTEWKFHLIGVDSCNFPSNVITYKKIPIISYKEVFKRADIAFGPLALHRIGMNESSSLKVREYLAFGLPVIIAGKDVDFLEGADFLLELPNTPENIVRNIEKIENFAKYWKGKRVERTQILHLDIKTKEKQRIKFFESVLRNRNESFKPY